MAQNVIKLKMNSVKLEKRSFFRKFGLPFLLFLSFVWLNFYSTLADISDVFYLNESVKWFDFSVIFSVAFLVLIEYLLFEVFFYIYRLFIGFSIYSFMIPKHVLIDKFRKWYIIRNIILGFIFNLRIVFPYITTYLCLFELVFNFGFIFCLYFDLKQKHVESLVCQYVFKTLTIPVVLYEAYVVITQMVGVL